MKTENKVEEREQKKRQKRKTNKKMREIGIRKMKGEIKNRGN